MAKNPIIVVDRTHIGRRASGIERITEDLFSASALAPLPVVGWNSSGSRRSMILNQRVGIPAAAFCEKRKLWIFSGYPPSPWMTMLPDRSILYVHDLFLIKRREELNRSAKLYMSRPFALALKRLRYFFVNSESTASSLGDFVRSDAQIILYRPMAKNVFNLTELRDASKPCGPLIVGALGTIEPRKNFIAAAKICENLSNALGRSVELHIIGRRGWGTDASTLETLPNVKLKGFLDDFAARAEIQRFDLFLSTSHDEGLGLPLLEMQFAGLLVVAPDKRVFREVLGESGLFIDVAEPDRAARTIAARLMHNDWIRNARLQARANLRRWQQLANADRNSVLSFLEKRLAALT